MPSCREKEDVIPPYLHSIHLKRVALSRQPFYFEYSNIHSVQICTFLERKEHSFEHFSVKMLRFVPNQFEKGTGLSITLLAES